jgi:Leucine-rich repeat (LRR) protein
LKNLGCWGNNLTSLDTSDLVELFNLDLTNNKMISLDLRKSKKIEYLSCSVNKLESLIIKNESNFRTYSIENNPNLKYICCDSSEKDEVLSHVALHGYNCSVVTDCF